MKRPKYGNTRVEVDGIKYASKAEAKRGAELRLLERAGLISDLKFQPSFDLRVNGVLICRYRADFGFTEDGKPVTEDVKGVVTDTFRIKAKLMKACHGIDVRVVP